jgi:hypothetical protein
VNNAGGVLYLDARKATGYNIASNNTNMPPWIDLSRYKANYSYTNYIPNSDFANTSGWSTAPYYSLSASNNILDVTVIGTGSQYVYTSKATSLLATNGNKIYIRQYAQIPTAALATQLMINAGTTQFSTTKSIKNYLTFNSGIITLTGQTDGTPITYYLYYYYPDQASSVGGVAKFYQPMLVDLTAIFGAGAEPTLAECDAMFSYTATTNIISRGNNATLLNMAGTTASGFDNITEPKKPCLVFDGTNDCCKIVDTPNSGSDILSAPFSLGCTFKMNATATDGWIFNKNLNATNNTQYGVFFNDTNDHLDVYINGILVASTANNSITKNTWYNFSFTLIETLVTTYINGLVSGSGGNHVGAITTRGNIRIGCRETTAEYFKGNLATLTVYTGNNCNDNNVLKSEKAISKDYLA